MNALKKRIRRSWTLGRPGLTWRSVPTHLRNERTVCKPWAYIRFQILTRVLWDLQGHVTLTGIRLSWATFSTSLHTVSIFKIYMAGHRYFVKSRLWYEVMKRWRRGDVGRTPPHILLHLTYFQHVRLPLMEVKRLSDNPALCGESVRQPWTPPICRSGDDLARKKHTLGVERYLG